MLLQNAGAMREFDAGVAADGSDSVAANNRAICRMYSCNLPGAIQVSYCMSPEVLMQFQQ